MGEVSQHIVAGFKATGLVPVNEGEVLKGIPNQTAADASPDAWARRYFS